MSPTRFASFFHLFASFPHQICFIPPPKRFIFLTDEQKIGNILSSFDLQWLCLMLGLVRASKVTWLQLFDCWLFDSTVHFQMSPQNVCIGWCKVTLVAFVWLFSAVCSQRFPQIAFMWGCKFTLAAIIWLLSNVHFQMCLQIICPTWSIVTIVAFVWHKPVN